MNKIKNLFTKYSWVLIILIVVIAIIGDSYLQNKSKTTTVTPTSNTKVATFGKITPGKSSQDDITSVLGRPTKTTTQGSITVSEFKSSNQYRFNEVTFKNGTATLIKQIINSNDNIDSTFITKDFGEAPFKLYQRIPNSTFQLYTYPQNGIAYLGHIDGTVKEIWYFEPVSSIDNFLNEWGQDYSTTQVEDLNDY